MKNTPVDYQTARKIIDGYGLPDFGKATIREVVAISTQLEQETKTEFIHMETVSYTHLTLPTSDLV